MKGILGAIGAGFACSTGHGAVVQVTLSTPVGLYYRGGLEWNSREQQAPGGTSPKEAQPGEGREGDARQGGHDTKAAEGRVPLGDEEVVGGTEES